MEISVKDYCAKTGESARAVQARLKRGTLKGKKIKNKWFVVDERHTNDANTTDEHSERHTNDANTTDEHSERHTNTADEHNERHTNTADEHNERHTNEHKPKNSSQTLDLALIQAQQLVHQNQQELRLALKTNTDASKDHQNRFDSLHKNYRRSGIKSLVIGLAIGLAIGLGVAGLIGLYFHFEMKQHRAESSVKMTVQMAKNKEDAQRISDIYTQIIDKKSVERDEDIKNNLREERELREELKETNKEVLSLKIMLIKYEDNSAKNSSSDNILEEK